MPDSPQWKQEYAQKLQLQEILRKLTALSNQLDALGIKHNIQVDQSLLREEN